MKLRPLVPLGLSVILLSSCTNLPLLSTSIPAVSATIPAPTSSSLPTTQPTPTLAPHSLTICTGSEPAELFVYNEMNPAKRAILSAIYDGPVDVVDFEYQPVILTSLPSLGNGEAVIAPVQVQEGDLVIDNSGALTTLQPGTIVRPSGCRGSDCSVTYEGGLFQMDRLRATFHLKPGIMWSDGEPVSAADSVFSYKIAMDPQTLYGNNGLASGSAQSVIATADYIALDDLTTQWIGLPGFLDPNYQADFFTPLPEHQLSKYSFAQLAEANEVLYSPLGWGPYRITGWESGQQVTLQSNPYYFRSAEGLPFFNQLVVRFIGENLDSNLAALDSGQCDLLLQDTLPDKPTSAMLNLLNSGSASLYLDPQPIFENLTFDEMPADPTLLPLFANVEMRRAVAACIDRTSLASAAFGGLVPPLDLALPAEDPLMAGASLSFPYDPAAGPALLDELGWTDTNGDGIREAHGNPDMPDGTPLSFTLTTTDTPQRTQVSALIADQLKSCGMDVTILQSAGRDLLAQSAEAALSGRRFELAELSSPMSAEALCELAETSAISSEANGWSGSNLSGHSDPDFDAACARAQASLPGMPDYTSDWQTVLRLFAEQVPAWPLFYQVGFTLARPDLIGVQTGFGQSSELQDIESFR